MEVVSRFSFSIFFLRFLLWLLSFYLSLRFFVSFFKVSSHHAFPHSASALSWTLMRQNFPLLLALRTSLATWCSRRVWILTIRSQRNFDAKLRQKFISFRVLFDLVRLSTFMRYFKQKTRSKSLIGEARSQNV